MANKNDEMDRNKNPQGSTTSNVGGTEGGFGGQGNTSQGQGGNFNQGATSGSTGQSGNTRPGGDAIDKDRAMNRDSRTGDRNSGRDGSEGSE